MTRPLRTGGAAAVVLALVATANTAAADPPTDEHPLRTAGWAAQNVPFRGVLEMKWSDGAGEHTESLFVEGANGAVLVRGGSAALASPRQRLVQRDGEWDLLWPVPLSGPPRPSPAGKYQLTAVPSDPIGDRPTRAIEFRDRGVLLERLSLDLQTGLLLRREQFGPGPAPSRTIGFEKVTIGGAKSAPHLPEKVVNAAASPVPIGRLPSAVAAPATLAGAYQRLGVYKRSGVTQVLYSDGLYDLSIFQQQGRLDEGDLPSGEKVAVGSRTGRHYVWPGGHVVVWEARGMVHTAVSDAPLAQVLETIRSIPAGGGSVPLLRRLRQVCRALVQPLA